MKKFLLFTLVAALLTACLPQDGRIPQNPLLSTLERKSGLIAYIGVDGNVYVSDQAGGKKKQLTDDAMDATNESPEYSLYQLPTWSPVSNRLAFAGTSGSGENATGKVYVADPEAGTVREIYASDTEFPFYLLWSPNDAGVSFLSTSASEQALILQSAPVNGGDRTIIDTGSPYYWSWAPDGRVLITHSGGAADSTTPDHVAFIRFLDSGIIESALEVVPASFQAPAWSPDGSRIVLTRSRGDQKEIILTDDTGAYLKTLGEFDLNAAFGWSPDSRKVAYIRGNQTMNAGALGDLHIVDVETDEDLSVAENVIGFFWSPNSEKLAYFVPFLVAPEEGSDQTNQELYLQLNMLDVKTGESRELFSYRPTQQFAAVLPYFDQYHQSNTIWSPDNNNLVLSFLDREGNPGIAIVAASGQLEPRLLAEGYLAFWSWK